MAEGWTISEALDHLHPPIPRRDLARLLESVPHNGHRYGGLGRRGRVYSIATIMQAHARWVRERTEHDPRFD